MTEKDIYDVSGFPRVLAHDFIQCQVEQTMAFSPSVHPAERVTNLAFRSDDGDVLIELRTELANVHTSRSVIIAAGVGAFIP